ncbi:MAG TPA: vWA domain-containing protein, partial [Gemmataceae bacterium]
MFALRRLLAVGTVLSLLALLASSHIRGQAGNRTKNLLDSTDLQRPNQNINLAQRITEELAQSPFRDRPLVLYRTEQGETLMALQVKPQLNKTPIRPRDYLLLIDTAAHMAGGNLAAARTIVEKLVGQMGADDKVAVWTVNTRTHDLSQGFQSNKKLSAALKKLGEDYPAGAVNLKDALPKAINAFDGKQDRQRLIVFVGSGQSIAGPMDGELRATLCRDMVKNQIAFYSVPLGSHLEPYNLHGFANGTGGKVVRLGLTRDADQWVKDMREAAAQPILYDADIKLPAEVVERYPTKLPPLRPDVPTLLVGKFNKAGARYVAKDPTKDEKSGRVIPGKPGDSFTYSLTGKMAGKTVAVPATSEKSPRADEDNFFLVNMVEQWKAAKDRPALLQADRALAFAYQRNQMARADLVAQAEW